MPSRRRNVRDDRVYRQLSQALKARSRADNAPCSLCHEPIDYDLPYFDKWAFTADHVEELQHGGALYGELRPAHRYCNSKRSNGGLDTPLRPVKTTYTW